MMLDYLEDLISEAEYKSADCHSRGQFSASEQLDDEVNLLRTLRNNYLIYREAAVYLATYVAGASTSSLKAKQETAKMWGEIAAKVETALKVDNAD